LIDGVFVGECLCLAEAPSVQLGGLIMLTQALKRSSWLLIALWVAGCGTEQGMTNPGSETAADAGPTGGEAADASPIGDTALPDPPPFSRDESDFSATEPENANQTPNAFLGPERALEAAGDGAAESKAPPSGRTEAVEEADIYRVKGNRLYYFNTYRGLLIYDISDAKSPELLSRVPVFGYPVEMFIDGTKAYVLLRDVLELKERQSGQFYFERHSFSQIVEVDIARASAPKIGVRTNIEGQLREGVSRKVGNTIYVVSHLPRSYRYGWFSGTSDEDREEAVYVYSFDISQRLKQVDRLEVFRGGSYWKRSGDGSYASRYFSGVAISATSNALMVVENWRQYASNRGADCRSSWRSEQQAVVSLIDISDPSGAIQRHAHFATRGQLTDQFKQTYFHDPKTGKATYLGIFARNEWTGAACESSRVIRNTLESWNVTDGAAPVRQDTLVFGKPDETVRGSAFDLERKVVYAITARAVDPLYALSFADPTQLTIRSAIDGLSGDMNVFRLVGNNKYLLGIGRDTSDACSGIADDVRRPTQVAVSLIDVTKLDGIRLVQRQCVTIEGARWVNSQVNWNLDQAHKMIGMHSDGRVNVITVPISYTKKVEPSAGGWWWYRHQTAVGLMSWKVGQQASLTNHATVVHPNGQVERSIVFTHGTQTPRRTMINLSDTHLSLVDIEDLDQPATLAEVEIAPYYAQIYRFGDYVVEQVGASYGYYGQPSKTEFRIKKLEEGQPAEKAPVVASFAEGQIQSVTKVGNRLVLFRPVTNDSGTHNWNESEALVYDLSQPSSPTRGGSVIVPGGYPRYTFWCGDFGYWGGYWFGSANNSVALRDGIVFHTTDYTYDARTKTQHYKTRLVTLDIADPRNPRVSQQGLTPAAGETFIELVPDGTDNQAFYLSSRQQLEAISAEQTGGASDQRDIAPAPQPKQVRVRYYARRYRWARSNRPVLDTRISVRGRLVRAFYHPSRLKLLLTREDRYGDKPATALHLHVEARDSAGQTRAYWQSSADFEDLYLSDLTLADSLLVVNANRRSYYDRYDSGEGVEQDTSNRLFIFDLYRLSFRETFGQPIGTYNMRLMGSHRGLLFFNLSGDGIMYAQIVAGKPQHLGFVRTLGWGTHIEFFGERALIASGHYGVSEVRLP
jgi:hypothetical protein